ncbi:hypothetical protein D3C75_1072500 [compost metagenome]
MQGGQVQGGLGADALGAAARVLGPDRHQVLDRGGQNGGQGAEAGQQGLGDRLDVALRLAAEQKQLQQLIVGQVMDAGAARTFAQPLAVAGVVRLGLRFFRRLIEHQPPPKGRLAQNFGRNRPFGEAEKISSPSSVTPMVCSH